MTLRICLDCTTTYAVGAPRCPHCGSERGEEQGADPYRGGTEPMPKITKHGGASYADTAAEPEDEETEVSSSPGNNSETSPAKRETSQRTSARDRQKRARTTGSRSSKGQTEGSAAGSTGGDGPKTPSTDETGTGKD